jgi:dienelactone hydrolase
MPHIRRTLRLALPALLAGACVQPLTLARDDSGVVLARQELRAPNPAERGSFAVKTLTYGSGRDRRRPEFRAVALRTRTVDGSKLASVPDQRLARSRRDYWGFGFDSMPVNGRVWYPDAAGPFPLVLVVHGNHDMKDFSDPGYAYLGELLASRGYVVASVDENFLNGNIRGENDARGWMLLQHLSAWQSFNDSAGSPLHRRVDMGNIALMGHSRGGEAVAVAAAFNRLRHYPDDARVRFDFGYGIKSIVAIAPVDGQYEPAQRGTPLQNVNYLVIHGSHDGDVSSFAGLRQYQRVTFTDTAPRFKSAVYMYRANHGQWNTTWGATDAGPRSARSLDLRGLVPPEDQRRFAEVYVSAFLDATLRGRREYLPLFRDHRAIGAWLPRTMYVTRFQDAGFRTLADYQEDVDVTTGSARGVTIAEDSLATWKEGVLPLRGRGSNQGTNGVWIGWNRRMAGPDTSRLGRPAAYAISLGDSLRRAWAVGAGTALELSLSPTRAAPGPRSARRDSTRRDSTRAAPAARRPAPRPAARPPAAKPDTTPFDLTVELVDAAGVAARVPLSAYGAVRRPLPVQILRRRGRDRANFADTTELVLQTYVIPLADGVRAEPRFDPARLATIRLVFDRTVAGTVVLDDVGLSRIEPAFLLTAATPRRSAFTLFQAGF